MNENLLQAWEKLSGWWGVGASSVVVLVLAWVVFKLGEVVLKRAVAGAPAASLVTQAARRPAAWLLPLLGLHIVLQAAPDALPGITPARRLEGVMLIAAGTWLLIAIVRALGEAIVVLKPTDVADNLEARRIQTQTRVMTQIAVSGITLLGVGLALMTFPSVRQIGTSLLASAGVVGIVAGFAARPVLGNLIAGLQIAFTQPIRLDDVVIVEGEWGWIEEITGTYVVVRLWDQRRLIVPLQWWIEHPFQNWTRHSAELIGTVFLWVDYRMPLAPLREELQRACEASPLWDKRVALLQVTEAGEQALQLRCLVTAASSPQAWDLRCHVREHLVAFIQRDYPDYLPRQRNDIRTPPVPSAEDASVRPPPVAPGLPAEAIPPPVDR